MCRILRGFSGPLFLLAWALAGVPGLARAQSASVGPLTAEEGGPLQRVGYTPTTEGADLVPVGGFRADLWMGSSNIFEQDSAASHVLFLDLERLITTAGVRYGVHDRLELGGRLTFETTGGGVLDGFISWWHHRLGLGNANRDKYPDYDYAQRLEDEDGELRLDVPRRSMALEDVRLFAKWAVLGAENGRKALSLRAVARIPTQHDQVSSERTDFALMMLGRLSGSSWHAHAMAARPFVRLRR